MEPAPVDEASRALRRRAWLSADLQRSKGQFGKNATLRLTPVRAVAHRAAVPLAYAIDGDQRLVTITGEYAGPVEWQDVLARIHHDPRHQPGFAFLRDLRNATTPVDAATVVEIAAVVRRFWPLLRPARAAILTRSEEDAPALVAQALADAERTPLRMFTNYDEAVAWLAKGLRQIDGSIER